MPNKPFYSQEPVVHRKKPAISHKKIAGVNPVGTVTHPGGAALKMVPRKPAQTPAFGEAHGFGHAPHQRRGALRVSGHVGAHQVGWPTPKVMKIPK